MKNSIIKSLAGFTLVGVLAASGTALADSGKQERTLEPAVTVRYGDLNLSSKEGAQILYNRIRSAAQQVCGPSFSLWDSGRWSKWKACYNETINVMVRRVNKPMLMAIHEHAVQLANR